MDRYIPCPGNNEECRYKDTPVGCHESIHHIFPRRNAETRLQRDFGGLACNKVKVCRNIHDLLDTFPPPEYPSPEEMKRGLNV